MPDSEHDGDGPLQSVRRLGRSLLGLARTRLELFALEVQEEKLRFLDRLVWYAVAVSLGIAGVLVAVSALALFLWRTAGYAGLVGLALVLLGAAAALLWTIRRQILHGPAPFAQTAEEFRKDAASLRSEP